MERMNFWNNHSNRSNRQALLSFIFCYDSLHSYYQLLPIEHYVAGNLQSAWNEWRAPSLSTFISPPWVRKCQSKQLNSLDKWPTVVLLFINAAYNNDHGSQLVMISSIAAKDVHPWESPQRKLGEISVLSVALTLLQIDPCLFFSVAVQPLLTRTKPI